MGDSGGAGCHRLAVVPVNDAEDDGNEDERGDRRKNQATDHGAAKRRVLLAALAETSAMGAMPMIMASAVISTGRKRT